MQSSQLCRSKLLAEGAMDRVVVTMSSYRKLKKPLEDGDEEEFLMELCNILSLCCMDAAGKQQFLDFEGIELMFIILRNRQMFRIGCVKVRPLFCASACTPLCVLAQVSMHSCMRLLCSGSVLCSEHASVDSVYVVEWNNVQLKACAVWG